MQFSEALRQGLVPEFGEPDRIIETLLSNVFFFGSRALKVYKPVNAYYGNLADLVSRKEFYREDFFWNHLVSPEIYLHFGGVRSVGGGYSLTPFEEGEDFYIEMAKVDMTRTLTELLREKRVSIPDMKLVTRTLLEVNERISKERKVSLKHQFVRGWRALIGEDWDDIRTMMHLAREHISGSQADDIIHWIKDLTAFHSFFDGYPASGLSVAIDNNCDNVLLVNGRVLYIDVLAPKESWRVVEEYFSVARTAVDAHVVGSPDLGDAVHAVYSELRGEQELKATLVCEIRSALIQWPYRHILGQHELAEKYKAFVIPKMKQLKDLTDR